MQGHSEGQGQNQNTVRQYKCTVSQSADGEYIVREGEQVSKEEELSTVHRLTDSEKKFIELSGCEQVDIDIVGRVNSVSANGLRISPLEYMDIYVSGKRVKALCNSGSQVPLISTSVIEQILRFMRW